MGKISDLKTNLLGKEKSPYLLQHKDNPVHWYPWGSEAFERARKENKPVFLSIGYSTCHWCHVMAHESFESPEIADILNEHFIAIKVDREERPDIDGVYMQAVVAMTGQGGWPLSVFLTPEQKPFLGGTYFPPEPRWGTPGFKQVLVGVHESWRSQSEKIIESGREMAQLLQESRLTRPASRRELNEDTWEMAYAHFFQNFDEKFGGFGGAPKFPSSHNLSFLLHDFKRRGQRQALFMAVKTLTAMSHGGMYDQIGGGFHRYSTDEKWRVPHFEKMLYDQATLAVAYLEAYQVTRENNFAVIAGEIFEYVLRDLRDGDGAFFSAEDADSLNPEFVKDVGPGTKRSTPSTTHVKQEGAFYLWRHEEIEEILGKNDAAIFDFYYGVEPGGNVEADPHGEFTLKNILYSSQDMIKTAGHFKIPVEEVKRIVGEGRKKLFEIREQRPRPHLDDKILVDWNGLMISGLAFGARVLDEPRYAKAAEEAARFILQKLVRKDGRLLHRYRDGEAAIPGMLDDYAFFVHGLIDLYQATFDPVYLKEAKRFTEGMIRLFWDEKDGGFFFTASDAEQLIYREKTIYDGAIPSGNAVAALGLLRLGRMLNRPDWEQKARDILAVFEAEIASVPYGHAQSLIAMDFGLGPSKEILISAQSANDPKVKAMLSLLYGRFLPNKVVVFRPADVDGGRSLVDWVPLAQNRGMVDDQPTVYVCQDHRCDLPTTDLKSFERLLGDSGKG